MTDVEAMKKRLTKCQFNPEAIAKVTGSSKPGKRKQNSTWNVSCSPDISPCPTFCVSVHLFVCTSQGLVAASEDLKKAVVEHDNPPSSQPPPLALTDGPKGSPAPPATGPQAGKASTGKAGTNAESAAVRAKEKEIQALKDELASKERSLESTQGELKGMQQARVEDIRKLLQGAEETGVCMHQRNCILHPTHYSSTLLVTGRAKAQEKELDHLRSRDTMHTNDIRMDGIRSSAEGPVAQQMAAYQFAYTLAAATGNPKSVNIKQIADGIEGGGMFPTPCHLHISL